MSEYKRYFSTKKIENLKMKKLLYYNKSKNDDIRETTCNTLDLSAFIFWMANIANKLRRESRNKNGKFIDPRLKPLVSFLQDVDVTMAKINKEQKKKELMKKARDSHEIYSKAQRKKQSIKNRNYYLQQGRNRTTN